jgi:tetratricopeptide (TPR) repeat protein
METLLEAVIASVMLVFVASLFKTNKSRKIREILNNPNDVENKVKLAITLYKENKLDEALRICNNINRNIDMKWTVLADYFKGSIYLRKLELSKAQENFEFVIQNKSSLGNDAYKGNISNAYYYLGGIYFIQNNHSLAKEYKEIAIKSDIAYKTIDRAEFKGYAEL